MAKKPIRMKTLILCTISDRMNFGAQLAKRIFATHGAATLWGQSKVKEFSGPDCEPMVEIASVETSVEDR